MAILNALPICDLLHVKNIMLIEKDNVAYYIRDKGELMKSINRVFNVTHIIFLLSSLLMIFGCGGGGDGKSGNPSQIPTNWHMLNPLPQGNTLNGVTYGNGIFVAVGQLGTIMTSYNGLEWQISTSGVDNNLSAVAFGNGKFITVGNEGVILISSNGVNWTPRISGIDNDLYDVTFGAGVFVVASGDKILTSADGAYWTTSSLGDTSFSVLHITYSNEIFIAVGVYTLISSPDGSHWSGSNIQQNPLNPYSSSSYAGVISANGIFYLVNRYSGIYGYRDSITRSIDGVNWETTNAECADAVAYGNGTFVIVNDGCPSTSRSIGFPPLPTHSNVLISSDGTVWSNIAKPLEDGIFLKDVTYGDGIFVAVGSNGVIFTSPQ